jgi:hypothetical protein
MIGGQFTMGVAHVGVGVFILLGYANCALASMLLFIFIFENTSGAITWLYCSEIAVDASLGFVGVAGYFFIFCLSLGTVPLMNSNLHESGTFFLFGVVAIVGGFWCLLYMKETSGGLTDSEKKSLYIPKDLLEYTKIKQEEMSRNTMLSIAASQYDPSYNHHDSSILSELTRELMYND